MVAGSLEMDTAWNEFQLQAKSFWGLLQQVSLSLSDQKRKAS